MYASSFTKRSFEHGRNAPKRKLIRKTVETVFHHLISQSPVYILLIFSINKTARGLALIPWQAY